MNAYFDRESVEMASIAFLLDGRRLPVEQTPNKMLKQEEQQFLGEAICTLSEAEHAAAEVALNVPRSSSCRLIPLLHSL
ncbi:hypothetical protein RJ639_023406 [Escallonia herrerae]|nr:hypothetical protein RJ639_023406 [Escallonia herrerae]